MRQKGLMFTDKLGHYNEGSLHTIYLEGGCECISADAKIREGWLNMIWFKGTSCFLTCSLLHKEGRCFTKGDLGESEFEGGFFTSF